MLALIAIGALLGYGLLCLASPVAKCPRTRVIKRKGKRPRVVACRKCKGRGHRYRPGARLVHSVFQSAAGNRIKTRFGDRYERISDAGHLEDD